MDIKCANCLCVPDRCNKLQEVECTFCIKEECCCADIHLKKSDYRRFFVNIRKMYATALGIEILCIASAEIGQNGSLFLLGYSSFFDIAISYVIGYGLAGFTTFVTILGRYKIENVMDGCCSVLDCQKDNSFLDGLKKSFGNFANGMKILPTLYKQPGLMQILKTSLYVLITAESACILTAETVDILLFKHGLWLSVPLALLVGAFTIAAIESWKKNKLVD